VERLAAAVRGGLALMAGYGPDEGGLPGIGELTGQPGDPDATLAEVRHQLGIGAPRVRYGGDLPPVHGLAQDLELA